VISALRLALQFLTRIPVSGPGEYSDADLGRSVVMYPLVGLLIGALLVVLHKVLGTTDAGVQAAVLLVAWVLITGALHLDGLADSADAWLGGHGDAARTLEIMKDPRSGPAATVVVALVLIVKFAVLGVLVRAGAWQALLLAPILGRAAVVALFLVTPYVRPQGIAARHVEHLPRRAAGWALLAVMIFAVLLWGGGGVGLVVAAALTGYGLRSMMVNRIGGSTGDTAGALIEVVETAVLAIGVWA